MAGISTQAASPLNARDLVNIINRFTFKLQRQEQWAPISGLSICACLLGAAYGFEGKTLDEFLKVLGTESVDIRSALSGMKRLRALLKEGGNFQDANSTWYRYGFSLDPEFSRVQEEEHDFKSGPMNADAISTFVRDNTNGLIDFSPDINPDTVLLLVSCLHFKALWESPFNPGMTSSSTFETFARGLIPCDLMQACDV
jgi:serpin B